jgi:hypothetical protein
MQTESVHIDSTLAQSKSKERRIQVDSNHQPIRHFTERHYEPGKIVEIPFAVARRQT